MMSKIAIRGILILVSFLGTWFLLKQVNWVGLVNINDIKENRNIQKLEKELGKLMISEFKSEAESVENPYVIQTIDSLVTRICKPNQIDSETIRVYIFKNPIVNAFALPDRQLVIYTGLIEKAETPEALSGVIAHELAHIERKHVMESLIKELGLGVLLSLISGQSDLSITTEIVQIVSSSAFSREMEKEADLLGVDYLIESQINPQPFAELMKTFGKGEFSALKWIQSHPMSKEREEYIMEKARNAKVSFTEIISPSTWESFKKEISSEDDEF